MKLDHVYKYLGKSGEVYIRATNKSVWGLKYPVLVVMEARGIYDAGKPTAMKRRVQELNIDQQSKEWIVRKINLLLMDLE